MAQGGFAPGYYKETYPSFGNKNMAGAMTNCDLTNVSYITQGPGLSNLLNPGTVTTLIKGILKAPSASDTTYAIGGSRLYQLSSTSMTADASFPHTLTSKTGEDVLWFGGQLYYSYNGNTSDIGKYNGSFDDDWGSTIPTGKANLQNAPHQLIGGGSTGNGKMYFANGRYVGDWDETTYDPQALDLPTGSEVQSIAWMKDRVWIAANKTTLTGSNKNYASIYVWDGTSDSWESEIPLMGTVGALHVKNGILYVFYQDLTNTGGYKLAYVDSQYTVSDLGNFTGGLPAYYQVDDYKDFIIWNANGSIWAFGASDKDLPPKIFQLADGGYSTVGGIATPFGTPLIASSEGSSYRLGKFSGYDTNSSWKSLLFDITGNGRESTIDSVRINFEQLQSNARVDWSLVNNQGITIYSDTISHDKLGAKTSIWCPLNGKKTENFRIQLDYSNGDTTNTVAIKSIKIDGTIN